MRLALVFSLVIAILAVIFALQNPQMADVQLGTLDLRGSMALILIVTFFIGVLVGVLAALPSWFRNRREVNRLRKRVADEPAYTAAPPVREERPVPPADTQHRRTDVPPDRPSGTPPDASTHERDAADTGEPSEKDEHAGSKNPFKRS